jgi:hypothetical protein
MRVTHLTLCFALLGCDESGTFTVVDPADDPSLDGPSDTDGGSETDDAPGPDDGDPTSPPTAPPAVSANNCGAYIEPEPGLFNEPVYLQSGAATLTQTGGFAWDWLGCEAERHFDAAGAFVCESVWNVTGSLRQGFDWNAPNFVFELRFALDEATTTCPGAASNDRTYGFDLEWSFESFNLQREVGDAWQEIGDAPFTANERFSEIELSYASEFTAD